MNPVVIGVFVSAFCLIITMPLAAITAVWSVPLLISQIWRRGDQRISWGFKRFFKATLSLLGISAGAISMAIVWPLLRIVWSMAHVVSKIIGVCFWVIGLTMKTLTLLLSFVSSKTFSRIVAWTIISWIITWTLGLDAVIWSSLPEVSLTLWSWVHISFECIKCNYSHILIFIFWLVVCSVFLLPFFPSISIPIINFYHKRKMERYHRQEMYQESSKYCGLL